MTRKGRGCGGVTIGASDHTGGGVLCARERRPAALPSRPPSLHLLLSPKVYAPQPPAILSPKWSSLSLRPCPYPLPRHGNCPLSLSTTSPIFITTPISAPSWDLQVHQPQRRTEVHAPRGHRSETIANVVRHSDTTKKEIRFVLLH